MTAPLPPPAKKDPQKRSPVPTLPPATRSRAALGLTVAAARGQFRLQHCAACGQVQYPPRDLCGACLSPELEWRDTDPTGRVIAETTVRVSSDPYFRDRLPWRMGTVRLTVGVSVLCHLHGDVRKSDPVTMALKLDRAGQGVMVALPLTKGPNMYDDPILRAMGTHPRHRRVLITDARAPETLPLITQLQNTGAAQIFVGEPETWRHWDGRDAIADLPGVALIPLDVTDRSSVQRMAAELGGKTDILINTARHTRPGGIIGSDTVSAHNGLETNVLGLMRLAQGFGPAMTARAADGVNNAVAFVHILSVHALSPDPAFGSFAASQAAARSVLQTFRAECAASGVRVMAAYCGPLDDAWHQPLPPPKLAPESLARAVINGLIDGVEDIFIGDHARDLLDRWERNAGVLERELRGQS